MVNRATLLGNVGKDPEIRVTEGGARVATFSIATSERWRDRQTGEMKERTEWHSIVVWGDDIVTKLVEPYVKKGSKLFVEGTIRTRDWEDKDHIKRWKTEIVIQGFGGTIQLVDSKRDGSRNEAPPPDDEPDTRSRSSSSKPDLSGSYKGPSSPKSGFDKGFDDEIPF